MNANSPTVLGLDIGGANLKAATAAGRAISVPFALWKQPDALPAALASLAAQFPEIDEFAVTMTGELCDCYATKREGVNRILDAVEFAANPSRERQRPARVWSTSGNWLSVAEARIQTLAVAASNWHALASFAGRFAPMGNGLLIDIGSTTTDIIPLLWSDLFSRGKSDFDRLRSGELIYVGVKRTPIMALGMPNLCAEYFADTRDVHIALRQIPEEPASTDTADGRSATILNSLDRLARMFGADRDTADVEKILCFALRCFQRQSAVIAEALRRVTPSELQTLVVSGAGEWLARHIFENAYPDLKPSIVALSAELGPEVSACAPAYAVAVLASEKSA